MVLTDKQMKELKGVLEIQSCDGNWNYDFYMNGIYNGMELMMAIIENREPVFKSIK